jgi:putative redox protein
VKRQFVEDVRGAKVREAAGRLGRPLMIMHAPLDPVVGVENASALFLAARHPKSFVSLDGADHLLTRREDAVFVARTLAAWAGRYVPDARVGFAAPAPGAPGEVMVAEAGGGKFVNWVVTADGHRMLADEPVAAGGTGLGPDPYEFVKAGLGACTAMTLRMYASRKGWPLERVQVAVSFTREHRDDCEHCEEGKPELVGVFRRRLMLEGPLDAEQRARLMEIADRCPVHRTLSQSSVIETIAG